VEDVFGEGVGEKLFWLGGLFGCGEKGELPGLAFFIQQEWGVMVRR
jgi:hypothetical protein